MIIRTMFLAVVATLMVGCFEPFLVDLETDVPEWGGNKTKITDSRQINTNFYIGQELKADEVVGSTDEFYLDSDTGFTVFAQVPEDEDKYLGILVFEMRNPDNQIINQEQRPYNHKRITGINYDIAKLSDKGGEGQWKILFFGDGKPLGQLEFGIYKDLESASKAREELAEIKGELKKSDYLVK
jgi:hypothetical protein